MATHHAHDTRVAYGVPGYSTRVRGECRFSPVQVFASAGFRQCRFSPFPPGAVQVGRQDASACQGSQQGHTQQGRRLFKGAQDKSYTIHAT